MNILITGGTGVLGRELVKVFPTSNHPTRNELDLRDRDQVFAYVSRLKPDMVINCAARTGIVQCENDKALAWRTNVEGTENLVKACQEYGDDVYFVHISTACVFYGDRGDYLETDIPYPKNFYSVTKLLSEFVVSQSQLSGKLIVRTNFVARQRWPYPKAFADRYGTYLFSDDLAQALKTVSANGLTGVVHVCGEEKMSMYDLAKITTPDVKPMTLADYRGPPVTVDMSLRSNRIKPFTITRTPPAQP